MSAAPDWAAVEREYRSTSAPVNDICRRHAIPPSTLRGRARRDGWQRPQATPPAARVAERHRGDVGRLHRLHDDLTTKATALVEAAATLRELADAAAAIERLGRITDRLITLERQAFGLDSTAPAAGTSGLAELLRQARERADGEEGENAD